MTMWHMTTIEGYTVGFTKPRLIGDDKHGTYGTTLVLHVDTDYPGASHHAGGSMTKEVRVRGENMAGELVFELHKLVRDFEALRVQKLLERTWDAEKADAK